MTTDAILLVLLSSVAHASWNLLAKRATTPMVFTWWMSASGAVTFAPAAVYFLVTDPPSAAGWGFICATIFLHTGYFFWLGRAYQSSDLSVVYPVARGTGTALIPILGVLALREGMSLPAAGGAALVVAGVFAVGGSGGELTKAFRSVRRALNDVGLRYALLTGLTIGGYSIIDKQGVQQVEPILYMYMLSAGGGLGMLALMHRSYSRSAFLREFRLHYVGIVLGGILQFTAYGLTLSALRLSPVSYVGPFREIGILFGVALGALVLKERLTTARLAGAVCIAGGAAAIALAP